MDFSGDAPRPPQHAPDQVFGDSLMRAGLSAGQQYVEQQRSAVISAVRSMQRTPDAHPLPFPPCEQMTKQSEVMFPIDSQLILFPFL
jgi:hypothetical protein